MMLRSAKFGLSSLLLALYLALVWPSFNLRQQNAWYAISFFLTVGLLAFLAINFGSRKSKKLELSGWSTLVVCVLLAAL
jgi:hypothetical protein